MDICLEAINWTNRVIETRWGAFWLPNLRISGAETAYSATRSRYSELEIDSWLLGCVALSACLSLCVIYTFIWFFTSYHEFFSCVRSWRLSTDEKRNSIFEFRITLPFRHPTIATFSGHERNLNHKRHIKWDTFSDIYPVLPWSFWHVHCSDISKHNLISRKRLEKKREVRISKLCVLGNFVSREVNLVLSLLSLHLPSFPLYIYLFIYLFIYSSYAMLCVASVLHLHQDCAVTLIPGTRMTAVWKCRANLCGSQMVRNETHFFDWSGIVLW
jgi:hypothetical protein